MNWLKLDSVGQFRHLLISSDHQKFAVFKHSTRCGISRLSKDRIERSWSVLPPDFKIYFLDLLTYRPVSDAVAQILDVEHQSPQILLVENGKCIYHSSHSDISIPEMASLLG